MSLVISGGTLIDDDPPRLRRAHLLIEAGLIRDLYADPPSMRSEREWLDASGCLVLPGFVCAHTHLYSVLARGMPGPKDPPQNFREVLERIWWPLDRALDREVIEASARIGAIEAIRCGVTTLIDHHAGPYACDGSLDIIADTLHEVGLRGAFCYEVSDREGAEESRAGQAENDRFLRTNQRSRARGLVGAHASMTLSDETLQSLAEIATRHGVGVHIHVAEDRCDEEDARERYGQSVIGRLARAGLLNAKAILAHGVHLDPEELRMVEQSGAWLVHNPRSNQNNRVGYAYPALSLPRVALGTDGIGADMIEEARVAYFRARDAGYDVGPGWAWSLLCQSQRMAGEIFGSPLGLLRSGAPADLVILAYDPPTPLNAENFAGHLVYGLSSAYVRDVIVGGRIVMRDRKILTTDEVAARAQGRVMADRLWSSIQDPGRTDPLQTIPAEQNPEKTVPDW